MPNNPTVTMQNAKCKLTKRKMHTFTKITKQKNFSFHNTNTITVSKKN